MTPDQEVLKQAIKLLMDISYHPLWGREALILSQKLNDIYPKLAPMVERNTQ